MAERVGIKDTQFYVPRNMARSKQPFLLMLANSATAITLITNNQPRLTTTTQHTIQINIQ